MPDLIDKYGIVKILKTAGESNPLYIVELPNFTKDEERIINNPESVVKPVVLKKIDTIPDFGKRVALMKEEIKIALSSVVPEDHIDIIAELAVDRLLGYGALGVLMRDEYLEEIMLNSPSTPVFVFHKKHGMCITNIEINSSESLNDIITNIAANARRKIDSASPLLDAHMPDGSRANVAIPPAAPYGPSITIRKFKSVPYNVIDLIKIGSISVQLAAFLWICIDGMGISPINMLIAGGAGSGKTTLLNALAMFIPSKERIVTVEDTLELNLGFLENWVPLEANPSTSKETGLTMDDLLKNTLRMRPDRVMVGEVRGREAQTLLTAMNIGLSGSMGTLHANDSREATTRLTEEPMKVPVDMIPLLDLIVVQNRIYKKGVGYIRRVTQVTEVGGMEKDKPQLGDIYKWNVREDKIERTEFPILLLEKLADNAGMSKKDIMNDISIREHVLRYMVDHNINKSIDVQHTVQRYNEEPAALLSEMKLI